MSDASDEDSADSGPPLNRQPEGISTTIDTACELLAARDRRAVVSYFLAAERDTATVRTLADYCIRVAPYEDSLPTRDQRILELHHKHLPKLDDAGVIEYDTRSKTVQYFGDDIIEDLLRVGHETA